MTRQLTNIAMMSKREEDYIAEKELELSRTSDDKKNLLMGDTEDKFNMLADRGNRIRNEGMRRGPRRGEPSMSIFSKGRYSKRQTVENGIAIPRHLFKYLEPSAPEANRDQDDI